MFNNNSSDRYFKWSDYLTESNDDLKEMERKLKKYGPGYRDETQKNLTESLQNSLISTSDQKLELIVDYLTSEIIFLACEIRKTCYFHLSLMHMFIHPHHAPSFYNCDLYRSKTTKFLFYLLNAKLVNKPFILKSKYVINYKSKSRLETCYIKFDNLPKLFSQHFGIGDELTAFVSNEMIKITFLSEIIFKKLSKRN